MSELHNGRVMWQVWQHEVIMLRKTMTVPFQEETFQQEQHRGQSLQCFLALREVLCDLESQGDFTQELH